MRGERGFALVITLIVTALLVALVTEFVNETYVDASHSHNFVASQQASVLSQSGVDVGRGLLELELGMGHSEYSSLLDLWAKPLHWEDESGSVTVTITEESGKLNLNSVLFSGSKNDYPYQGMMRTLLQNLKLPTELCDTVTDWVNDPGKAPQLNGAKGPYYNGLNPPYDLKGAKLQTVEELGLVKGFTRDYLAKLKPYVTVYGADDNEPYTKININTAPEEVLRAIGGFGSDVSSIIDYRKTKPIKNLSDIPGLRSPSPSLLSVITFRGSVFRIVSEGKVGESVSVTEAVVRVPSSGTGSQILYWREY